MTFISLCSWHVDSIRSRKNSEKIDSWSEKVHESRRVESKGWYIFLYKKEEKEEKRDIGGFDITREIRISLSRDWYFSAHVVSLKVEAEKEREKGNGDVPTAASLQHLSSIAFYALVLLICMTFAPFLFAPPLLSRSFVVPSSSISLLPFTIRDVWLDTRDRALPSARKYRRSTQFLYVTQRELSLSTIGRDSSNRQHEPPRDLLTKRTKVFQLAFLSYIIHTKKLWAKARRYTKTRDRNSINDNIRSNDREKILDSVSFVNIRKP